METTSIENNNFKRVIKLYGTIPLENHIGNLIRNMKNIINNEITTKFVGIDREKYINEIKHRYIIGRIIFNTPGIYYTTSENYPMIEDNYITVHIPYYTNSLNVFNMMPKRMLSNEVPEELKDIALFDITLTRDEICFDICNTTNSKEDILLQKDTILNNILRLTDMVNGEIEEYNNNLEKVIGDIFDKRMNTVKLQKEIMDSLEVKVK